MTDYNLELEKNKVNNVYEEILNLSDQIRLEYIIDYTKNFANIISDDFDALTKTYLKSDKKYLNNKLKIIFLELFLINKKQFNGLIDLKAYNNVLEDEILKFINKFSSFSEYLENKIIMDFEMAVEIAIQNNDKETLKKIYSCYQTMLVGIINMLPISFEKSISNFQNFKDAFEAIKILNLNLNLEINDFQKFYVKIIEEKINEILSYKYDFDLYNYKSNILKRI